MTSFREMMASREASKERGAPSSFTPRGKTLVRDEGGSFHKVFAFNSPYYHPYRNLTAEEKRIRAERDPYFGRRTDNIDQSKDLSPMQIALVNAQRAQPTAKEDLTSGETRLRGAGNYVDGSPGKDYVGVDEFGFSVSHPATDADKNKYLGRKMDAGRTQDTVKGGVTTVPVIDAFGNVIDTDVKPKTEIAQKVIDEWGLTPEGGKLDEPKSETRRKEERAREEARDEWNKEHWEPEWSSNYHEPDESDDEDESDDDETEHSEKSASDIPSFREMMSEGSFHKIFGLGKRSAVNQPPAPAPQKPVETPKPAAPKTDYNKLGDMAYRANPGHKLLSGYPSRYIDNGDGTHTFDYGDAGQVRINGADGKVV